MKYSDVKGRQVVTLGNADKIGYIDNAYVSDDGANIIGFEVALRGLMAGHRVFTWDHLSSIGADAVTIPDEEALHELNRSTLAQALSTSDVVGAKVMAERGDDLGKVGDIEFDGGSGAITQYLLSPSVMERIEGHRESFAPSAIQSMSASMLVVADGAVQRES
jgi:uncharacterized protein YrrD